MPIPGPTSSFAFLAPHGPLYLQLATVAESALALDPNLTLLKLRQLAEAFAQRAAGAAGLVDTSHDTSQHDLLRCSSSAASLPNTSPIARASRRGQLSPPSCFAGDEGLEDEVERLSFGERRRSLRSIACMARAGDRVPCFQVRLAQSVSSLFADFSRRSKLSVKYRPDFPCFSKARTV